MVYKGGGPGSIYADGRMQQQCKEGTVCGKNRAIPRLSSLGISVWKDRRGKTVGMESTHCARLLVMYENQMGAIGKKRIRAF